MCKIGSKNSVHRLQTLLFSLAFFPSGAPSSELFAVDVASVVGRSDIVMQRPNLKREEAMPLGNGRLGVAVWSENGLTLQLNRADTLPNRLSPGQVVLPGLKSLTDASDYAGRLDLYRGEFREQGGGLKVTVYVQPDSDTAVIDVTGANPDPRQTAILHLWQPRKAQAALHGSVATLSETWKDTGEAGASGEAFGSLAAITADARDLHADVQNPLSVKLSFRPKADGSFRLFIAAPEWKRSAELLTSDATAPAARHQSWWNDLWHQAGLMKMTSEDGAAEYFENLRCIDLYTAAAESLGRLPGSQAGIGDLFSSMRDEHKWGPSAYWHWNLRMQVAANLGAGLFALNNSYFSLYRENLQNIEAWTAAQMAGRPGACVPETMRFNGKGYENESWLPDPGVNCSAESKPYYNARTLSTGAEVSLWIWRQYLATQDRAFLASNYPVMAASARFLLAYAKRDANGMLHMYPSNAHENEWDVHDPTTDLSAMKSFFPAVASAARILHTDPQLVTSLESALSHLPELPVSASDGSSGTDVIAQSYDRGAAIHNSENIGLEPVWPYSLVGDSGQFHYTGVRTYASRPNKFDDDWSFDPIQAARLGLASEVELALRNLTERYQAYPSGLAQFMGTEFYVEQVGVLTAALQESLVQDYDGLVRIAPAWPKHWDVEGTVYIQGKSKVDVQIQHGVPMNIILEAGSPGQIHLRNPWPGAAVEVVTERNRSRVAQGNGPTLDFGVEAGQSYLIRRMSNANSALPSIRVTGTLAAGPKALGARRIGLQSLR